MAQREVGAAESVPTPPMSATRPYSRTLIEGRREGGPPGRILSGGVGQPVRVFGGNPHQFGE